MTAPISVNAANLAAAFVAPLPEGRAHPWNGLADGQRWTVEPGTWSVRLDPRGRAHVIGWGVDKLGQNPGRALTVRSLTGDQFGRACEVAVAHNRKIAEGVGNGDALTLGQMIADSALEWESAGDLRGWRSEKCAAAWDALLTLCDRADAAERLAHAADALGWTAEADHMAGAGEFKAALKAWREVSGE